MLRLLRATARGLLSPLRLARRRPWAAAAAALALATAVAGAGWACARYQWQAARAALAADRPQEARAQLALPLALWRWDPEVQVLAARAARMSGDLPAAEAHLKRSLRLAGGATEAAQLEFLLLRVQTGEIDRVAGPLLEAADRGHPDAPLILSTLAVAYMNNLRDGRAYACLSRWVELRPDAARAYQFRGWVLERLGRRKEALPDYEKALEIDPDLLAARLRLAEMLLEDHQPQLALPHLERLSVQVNLARLDVQEGRAAAAERRLRDVLHRDPSDSEALFTLFSAVKAQGREEDAREVLAEYERAKALLARTHKLLREVVETASATPADYAELGELLLGMKQEDRGLYWLYKALERDPDNQRSHRVLAEHYERKGDAGRAASHRYHVRQR